MTIEKPKSRARRYFARDGSGLRNGSFLRASRFGVAQFINGDYMGMLVKSERAKPLEIPPDFDVEYVEFDCKAAEKLVPECCGGKGGR